MYIQQWQRNKYGAIGSTYTRDGGETPDYYHSKKEAGYARELDLRKRCKDIKDWERQIRIPLEAYGKKICIYIIDFKVIHNDQSVEWVEVKGAETDVWKMKWKLFEAMMEAIHPEEKLTIVK